MNALFDRILEHPDDDGLRLVMADAMEEAGDPARAELVRWQCRLAEVPAWSVEARELAHDCRLAMALHGRRWRAELPRIEGVRWGRFERGFPVEARVDSFATLAKVADRIQAAAPIAEISIEERVTEVADVALPGVHTLRLDRWQNLDEAVLAELLGTRLCAGLTTLALPNNGIENAGAARIAAADLPHLEHLVLQNGFIGELGITALASAGLDRLRTLNLSCTASGYVDDPFANDAAVDAIVEGFPALEALFLSGNRVGDPGVRRLLESSLPLRTLVIQWSGLTDGALEVGSGPVRLESLGLQGAQLSDRPLDLPQLSELRRLDLAGTGVGPEVVRSLARSPARSTLADLRLSMDPVRAEGIRAMGMGSWSSLHTLVLTGSELDATGARLLSERRLPVLRDLRLGRNAVSSGVAHLTKARWWAHLRRLDLPGCALETPDVLALVEAPSALVALDLSQSPLAEETASALGRWNAPRLRELQAAGTFRGSVGEHLGEAPWLRQLVLLGLAYAHLTDADLEALVRRGLPNLRHLDIAASRALADADLAGRLGGLDLIRLEMPNCLAPTERMDALLATPMYAGLSSVRVEGNRTRQDQLDGRQHGRPGPELQRDDSAEGW
ncbi:MAG: TIGR02996 domain-containing protein [Myxococcota bacterium]